MTYPNSEEVKRALYVIDRLSQLVTYSKSIIPPDAIKIMDAEILRLEILTEEGED